MFSIYMIAIMLLCIQLCNSHVSLNHIITNHSIKEAGLNSNNQNSFEDNVETYASVNLTSEKEAAAENIHKSPVVEDVTETIEVGQIYENTRVSNSHDEREGYVTHSELPRGWMEGVYEQPGSGMGEVLESDHKERGGALTYQLANKNDAEINPRLNKPDVNDEFSKSQSPHRNEMGDVNTNSGVLPTDVQVDDFMKSHIDFSIQADSSVRFQDKAVEEPFNSSFVESDDNNKETTQKLALYGTIANVSNKTFHVDNGERTEEITEGDNINDDSNILTQTTTQHSLPNLLNRLQIPNFDQSQSTKTFLPPTEGVTELTFNTLMRHLKSQLENATVKHNEDKIPLSISVSNFSKTNHFGNSKTHNDTYYDEPLLGETYDKTTEDTTYSVVSESKSAFIEHSTEVVTMRSGIVYGIPYVGNKPSDGENNTVVQTDLTKHYIEGQTNLIKSTSNDSYRNTQNGSQKPYENGEDLPTAERLYWFDNEREHEPSTPPTSIHPPPSRSENTPEEEGIAIKGLLNDHTPFEKQKIEPAVLFEDCSDCDLRLLPIRPAEQRSAPKMEVEHLPNSKIRFSELPEGRKLKINGLDLSDGIFLFSYLSEFLSWIQPNDFPVELLRDALKTQNSWISIVTETVQVEVGFVVCLVTVVLLALAVPMVVLSHTCYRMGGRGSDQEEAPGWGGNCKRRTLVFILQLLLILLFGGMVAMFATNEQLSGAVVQSSDVMQTSLGDVSSFIHNAHLQLHFLITQSVDQVLQAIYADLDNVDSLLGRRIQQELVRETGLDVALDSLGDLTKEAKETTQQVERFLDEARVAQEMLVSSRDKLSDLRQQVELFRRACGPRDRTLCDTIDATGLDITLRIDRIKSDDRLNRMRRIGSVALETATREAKEHYLSVPNRVEVDTRDAREAVRRQLSRQRAEIDESSRALEQFARDMTTKVTDVKYEVGSWMQHVDEFEYWRWIACVGGGAAVLMIWSMLLSSMCCGCCGSEKAAGPTILLTVVLVCLFSTVLWSMVLVGLLVGGHGEVFVCRPLYDEPEYRVITDLVDQPGVFYTNNHGGFIANVLYGNETLDVPIKQVLQDCHDNRAIYPTLGLHRVFNMEAAVDQHRWSSVGQHLRAVRANLSSLEVLSPHLQDQLSDLLATLSVNFTEHRIQMSKPVTGKDLDSFARQLDNIGNQMRDLATASRMETLSSRTRRLIDSHIRPLEVKKDSLVYQLTALEVQTGPLLRQVNQSLSHLKTIQFFINSQGESIAHSKSREYVERLVSYVDQLRDHVMEAAMTSVAPCRPLWDIFHSTRLFLCRHTMDPLNGFWFATMWCLLVFLVATPVCLKLVDYYRVQSFRSSGSPTENLVIAEQGAGWSSPGYDIKCSKKCDS